MTSDSLSIMTDLVRMRRIAFVVGLLCLVPCAVGGLAYPAQFFRAYLIAYLFCVGSSLGCLVLLMIYHLTGGAWGFLIRHFLEAGVRMLPVVGLSVVPLAFGLGDLYTWAEAANVTGDAVIRHKELYLNTPFFLARTAIYFAVWIALALILDRWSQREDKGLLEPQARRFRILSGPGLAFYGLTITFAAIDWIMSLQPHWYSTIFAPLYATSQCLNALAFVVLMLSFLADRPPLVGVIAPDSLNDLGNLLLAFVMLWSYMAFSQFLLIWTGNLREEIPWYLMRMRAGWEYVGIALILFHFAVPFLFLLSRQVKRTPRLLGRVAAGILFMRLVALYWDVMPAFSTPEWEQRRPELSAGGMMNHWMDLLAPVGLGGILLAGYLWQLGRRPLLPVRDPSGQEADRLHRLDLGEVPANG